MRRFIMMGQKQSLRCFSSSARSVMSFGDGSHGALGLPSSLIGLGGDAYEPTPVPGLPSDVCSVSAGHYHSLAVTAQGEVWAWGRNHEGQLGRGLLAPRSSLPFSSSPNFLFLFPSSFSIYFNLWIQC